MGRRGTSASQSLVRSLLTLALGSAAALAAIPACSSGEDFTAKSTGGAGGSSGDASTTGGSAGTSTGGASGSGTGGVSGSGTGGVSGSGTGGASGAGGGGGTGGNPGGKPDGQPCANNTECKSNYCVDEVCCESECKGDCRSCKVSGKEGLCTPYTQGTDPEGDCVGAGQPTDPCAGTCDGKAACGFPSSATSCGTQVCASASQSTYNCDGVGACKTKIQPCDPYQCSGSSCLTACSADSQCLNSHWCENPKCLVKLGTGAICPKDTACQSGHCVAGQCCPTGCEQNFTCETGSCKCNGVACAAGASCIVYYADLDGDKFGDLSSPVLGCSAPAPSNAVLNSTDCDDGDKNAFPGQTLYFDVPRKGKGGYDYNCDKVETRYYSNVSGKSCGRCAPGGFCNTLGCDMGWGCNPSGCSGNGPAAGYFGDVACGQSGTLQTCSDNPGVSGCQNVTGTVSSKLQPCL